MPSFVTSLELAQDPTYDEVEEQLLMDAAYQMGTKDTQELFKLPTNDARRPVLYMIVETLRMDKGQEYIDEVTRPTRVEAARQYLKSTAGASDFCGLLEATADHDLGASNRLGVAVSPPPIYTDWYVEALDTPEKDEKNFFRPTTLALTSSGQSSSDSSPPRLRDPEHPNYLGDTQAKSFANGNIPEYQNCALFVTGIPAEANYADIFASIRCGPVAAVHINPPTGIHLTIAAKIVFKNRLGAVAFLSGVNAGTIFIKGQRVSATWNRNSVGPHTPDTDSRVIRISSKAAAMDLHELEAYFRTKFDFNLEYAGYVRSPEVGMTLTEWSFARIDCQAKFAMMVIRRELSEMFTAYYVMDPCDPRTYLSPW